MKDEFNFPKVLAGEVIDINWGNTSITKESYTDDGYIAFSASGGDGFLPFFEHEGEGIVLSAIGANCGKCFYTNGKWTAIKNTITFAPKKENVDFRFLYYYLNQPDIFRSHGGGQPFITLETSRNLQIPLPPLTEQKRIASLLARADRLRQLRRTAHDLGDALLQSVFLEMFGDPIKNNPNGYEICELKDVCKRITDGTHQPPEWAESGVPFLFVSNVVDGELTFDTKKFISEETWYELQKRCPIELNDILFTIVGSYGNAALVKTTRKFSFQRHIAHVKPNSKKILPIFLLGMMGSINFREQVEQQVRGVAQKTLNLGELQEIKIFVPPLSLQEEFAGVVARVESLRGRMGESTRQVEGLFESLLAQSFDGGR